MQDTRNLHPSPSHRNPLRSTTRTASLCSRQTVIGLLIHHTKGLTNLDSRGCRQLAMSLTTPHNLLHRRIHTASLSSPPPVAGLQIHLVKHSISRVSSGCSQPTMSVVPLHLPTTGRHHSTMARWPYIRIPGITTTGDSQHSPYISPPHSRALVMAERAIIRLGTPST